MSFELVLCFAVKFNKLCFAYLLNFLVPYSCGRVEFSFDFVWICVNGVQIRFEEFRPFEDIDLNIVLIEMPGVYVHIG